MAYRALDLEEGKADRGLPVLWTFQDKIVEGVADLGLSVHGTRVVSRRLDIRVQRGLVIRVPCARWFPHMRRGNGLRTARDAA